MRYVILDALGRSGAGTVHRARDSHLGRDVAIKLLGSADTAPAIREGRLAATVIHPNLVTVLDVGLLAEGPHAGHAYVTMDLVRGESLRAFIGKSNVNLAAKLDWLTQLASALEAVHAAGLVHCDVKPENVMIASDGALKLVDFGVARSASSGATTTTTDDSGVGSVASGRGGTPAYLAPERITGRERDARSDQFAWSVVAYELLVGRLPWGAERMVELVAAILQAPMKLPAHVPKRVRAIVERAAEKEPERRYPTMTALLAALAARNERSRRWMLALIPATLAFAGAVFFFKQRQQTASPSAFAGSASPTSTEIEPTASASMTAEPTGVVSTATSAPSSVVTVGAVGQKAPAVTIPPTTDAARRGIVKIEPVQGGDAARVTFARGDALPHVSRVWMFNGGGAVTTEFGIYVDTITADKGTAVVPYPPTAFEPTGPIKRYLSVSPGNPCTFAPRSMPPPGPIDNTLWRQASVGTVSVDDPGASVSAWTISVRAGSRENLVPGVAPAVAVCGDTGVSVKGSIIDVSVMEAGFTQATIRARGVPSALVAQKAKLCVYYREAKCR
ncbi:hypothetical protein BH09MYX1_BH09MYX1_03120 [soil metagenome]